MKTRFLLIAFFTLISSIMIPVFAVPELDPAQAFEYSDYVVLGKIIAVDIISDPVIHKSEKTYSEKSGVALYDITVVTSYKNPDNRTLFTIPGYFLYEPHAMSYDTYPYEIGQTVMLYIQKNTDENVEGKLIIRSGDSRVLDGSLCELGTSYHRGICIAYDLIEPEPTKEQVNIECNTGHIPEGVLCASGYIRESNTVTIILMLSILGIFSVIVVTVYISYNRKIK